MNNIKFYGIEDIKPILGIIECLLKQYGELYEGKEIKCLSIKDESQEKDKQFKGLLFNSEENITIYLNEDGSLRPYSIVFTKNEYEDEIDIVTKDKTYGIDHINNRVYIRDNDTNNVKLLEEHPEDDTFAYSVGKLDENKYNVFFYHQRSNPNDLGRTYLYEYNTKKPLEVYEQKRFGNKTYIYVDDITKYGYELGVAISRRHPIKNLKDLNDGDIKEKSYYIVCHGVDHKGKYKLNYPFIECYTIAEMNSICSSIELDKELLKLNNGNLDNISYIEKIATKFIKIIVPEEEKKQKLTKKPQ